MAIESVAIDDEDDDLNDFTALKTKTEAKRIAQERLRGHGVVVEEAMPKTIERDVVIDDFIRNFL